MNYTVKAGARHGEVCIPASKSFAHRLLICSALSDRESTVICDGISKDIDATINCLGALGAVIEKNENEIKVKPITAVDGELKHLFCGESGSTLRFLIPVVGALGANAVFHMEGRLSQRPLDAYKDTLCKNGMNIVQQGELLYCSGKLSAGQYRIPGNISSQYISGMLFALSLLDGSSTLEITEKIESADYIVMTENAVRSYGISFEKNENGYKTDGNQKYKAPKSSVVERDWSNAAFFMCMGAFSKEGITLHDMNLSSSQGDMEIINILRRFGAQVIIDKNNVTVRKNKLIAQTVDASAIPDLVPVVSVLASAAQGTTHIINAQRLRLKESDRLKTTADMLSALGADIKQTEDGLIICGKKELCGGDTDAANDHRIAMSAAVAASICKNDVTVNGAECVAKSYPDFWKHIEMTEVTL